MQKNSQNFSMQEALRLANSDAGQRLLALLKDSDSRSVAQASQMAAQGDYAGAGKALQDILNTPQVQALLRQLGGDHG